MEKFADKKVIGSVIIAVVIIAALMYAYHKFVNTAPVGSLTAAQFGQLTAAQQANYTRDTTSGLYIPKG